MATDNEQLEELLRLREEQAKTLTSISLLVTTAELDEIDQAIERALAMIASPQGIDRAFVNVFTESGSLVSCIHEWCADGVEPQRDYVQNLETKMFSWTHRLLDEGKVVDIPDLDELPPAADAERRSFGRYGVRSVLQVPMTVGGELIGLIGFNSLHRKIVWHPVMLELAQAATDVIAHALTRRQAQEAIQTAHAEAEAANRAKTMFLSRMSHELRTPLNAVLGFTELMLLEEGRPDSDRLSLERIQQSGTHLLALVEDLLDVGRIESGKLSMSIEPVDLLSVVRTAVEMTESAQPANDIRTEIEPEITSLRVRADRQRLQQVVVNVLSNAHKYNREGGSIRVGADRIRPQWTPSAGGDDEPIVRLTIADTGIGVPSDKLARVFEPFDRLGREEGSVEGTGIGLTLSKMIVEGMGGAIALHSIEGEGTTVTIDLAAAPAVDPYPTPAGDGEQSLVILGAEDNEASALLLRRVVEGEPGCQFRGTTTVADTLAMVRQQPTPALVLLDLHLADGSGEVVLKEMQIDPTLRSIPVVVVTADAEAAVMRRTIAAGAVDFLPKPVSVARLREVIQRVAHRSNHPMSGGERAGEFGVSGGPTHPGLGR